MTAPAKIDRLPNFSGSRAFEDLPHQCSCGARWSGSNTCHCGACHEFTFTGAESFSKHRKGGRCNPPETVGLALVPGRAYKVWSSRSSEGETE